MINPDNLTFKEYEDELDYQEFLKYMDEWNKKQEVKREKFQESLLYTIYKYFKK